jgi:hypothetical protein
MLTSDRGAFAFAKPATFTVSSASKPATTIATNIAVTTATSAFAVVSDTAFSGPHCCHRHLLEPEGRRATKLAGSGATVFRFRCQPHLH